MLCTCKVAKVRNLPKISCCICHFQADIRTRLDAHSPRDNKKQQIRMLLYDKPCVCWGSPFVIRSVIEPRNIGYNLVGTVQTSRRRTDYTRVVHLRGTIVCCRLPCKVDVATLLEIAGKLRVQVCGLPIASLQELAECPQ